MEEDLDSIKENINDKDEPINKSSSSENGENKVSEVDNINAIDTKIRSNNQKLNNDLVSEINKKVITPIQNDFNSQDNSKTIIDKTPNSASKDFNRLKVSDESESTNVSKLKPKKEMPIEKKPFNEFINDHLLPSLKNEFKERGLEVGDINLENTSRPIAGDKCWVVYCEIKNICNFWLSFEKNDISASKSISLCKTNQKPSVIESFLIDEKRITLKLIISRIFQRLNGQKLLGNN